MILFDFFGHGLCLFSGRSPWPNYSILSGFVKIASDAKQKMFLYWDKGSIARVFLGLL